MNISFLSLNQIEGENKLDVLKKYGVCCAATDYAILLGGYDQDDYYVDDDTLINNRALSWFTKSIKEKDIILISNAGEKVCGFSYDNCVGIRPTLSYSSISSLVKKKRRIKNDILEIEYGEYPQTIASKEMSKRLEEAFQNKIIHTTGKVYTIDDNDDNVREPFKAKEIIEYEYCGRKYIRIETGEDTVNEGIKDQKLSNGELIKNETCYWIEVEPIKWIVDEKTEVAISKSIILSGFRIDNKNYCDESKFDDTLIKKYLNDYFSREMLTKSISGELLENEENSNTRKNPYNLNSEEVDEEDILKAAIDADLAVLLHGKSSDGKSARVKAIDPDCRVIYLRNATPESLNGKSVYDSNTGKMKDIKPTWLEELEEKCKDGKIHIVFFDEITNALPSIQGMAFNIVLDKEVNGKWKLPENARIVAAGNEYSESLAANKMAEPLYNRFVHIFIETTTEKWLKWASEHNIHPAIYSYIASTQGKNLRTPFTGEKPNADPRKWEMASKLLYKTNNPHMLRGLLGKEVTDEFIKFCQKPIITIKDVLEGNYTDSELRNMNLSEKNATAYGLSQVSEEYLDEVRFFVTKLGSETTELFDTLWLHRDPSRLERLQEAILENRERLLQKTKCKVA